MRAGDQSLHKGWFSESSDRNWDLALSFYGSDIQKFDQSYDFLHLYSGSKWEGVSDFFAKNWELIQQYRYVWIPDDDLDVTSTVISNFFELCDILELTIAQPSLTVDSPHSWRITLQQELYLARLTNFVEIMAPCFNVEQLEKFKWTFELNSSGHGYEWLWKEIAVSAGIYRFGILDRTPVRHTRAVGSAGSGGARKSTDEERESLFTRFNIKPFKPKTLAYLTQNKKGEIWQSSLLGQVFRALR